MKDPTPTLTTDWQLPSPYDAGYACGFNGGNDEFDNPYWRSHGQEELDWLRGFAHGAMCEEFRKEVYER